MILEYGAKNFFCFKEWISVSFKIGANCPQHISQGKPVTNILAVKGANGAGKTNALKILAFLREFAVNSFGYKPEDTIKVESYFGNNEPIDFYIEFVSDGTTYKYELSINNNEVISEVFYKKLSRYVKVIDRKKDKIIKRTSDYNELDIVKLRKNASIISTANQYEVSSINKIYNFFNSIIPNVTYSGLADTIFNEASASKFYYETPILLDFVKDVIRKCDIGVHDIKIESKKDKDGNEIYFPIFCYLVNDNEECLTFRNQSSGTKSLYLQLGFYKITINTGGLLVLDEFDINLHPHILPILLEMFTNDKLNPNNAQIIFTTHNSEILDFLGKYRTVLVNKEENECYGYRLDEIPGDVIRNDRPLAPVYNSGKIGGVPRV